MKILNKFCPSNINKDIGWREFMTVFCHLVKDEIVINIQ